MKLRDLRLRVRALLAPRRVERELADELDFHIERETEKLVASGLGLPEARQRARARCGSLTLAAEECRDARGTAFVDACARDVVYALRTFGRAPGVALTIVATVALGLGLAASLFTLFNRFAFREDAVRDPEELFAVVRPQAPGAEERVRFTRPQYETLRRETSVFSDVFGMLPDIDSRIDGRMMGGTLVTGNFFRVLGVEPALGRALTPADDGRDGGAPVMVLSQRGLSRIFSNDPGVLGRKLIVNGASYEIVGVMPEGFRGLAVAAPDYWAPLSRLGEFRPFHAGREDRVGIDVIGRLKPGMSRRAAAAGLAVWDSGRADAGTVDRRSPSLTLEPRRGTLPEPLIEVLLGLSPLFFAFGMILMIAWANVANLLLARAVSRQREIGIRLSLGAPRRRIVRQLLTESLLLALAAAACGFLVSRLVLEATVAAVTATLPPELAEFVRIAAPAADWRVALFLVAGAVLSTVGFGLAPALQATRLELVRTMRGEVAADARPSRARNLLIGVQVTAAALLLICASVFLRSALQAAAADPGLRTSDTLIVEMVNEPLRPAMLAAVAAEPLVAAVAASWPDSMSRPRAALASPGGEASRSPVAIRRVSPEYFDVLDIRVLRGRAFTREEGPSGAAVAVVSEAAARSLWPSGDAIGQVLHVEPDPDGRYRDEPPLPSRDFVVVGVVRDVAGFRFTGYAEAGVYLPTGPGNARTALTLRAHGDPERARRALLERLTIVDPNMGQVMTLRTLARMQSYLLQIGFWVTLVLGGLALALTLSGLFSVLSYLVEQRSREIGVRMALGATARDVAGLVLSQSLRPVGIGLGAGAGMAAALAIVLMSTPLAAQIGNSVRVLDPVAYVASLAFIVTACVLAASIPALRAARIDPMATLRQD